MRKFLTAAGHLVILSILLWGGAYLITHNRQSLALYQKSYNNALAHVFAGKLHEISVSNKPAVLLLGGSSVHEGFDEKIMDATAPEYGFYNGATSLGTVYIVQAVTEIMEQYGVKVPTIVVGLNPHMLKDRELNLVGAGYTDFYDYWNGWDVLQYDDPKYAEENYREAMLNSVWPGHRFARQGGRYMRISLAGISNSMRWGQPLALSSFELSPGELSPVPPYLFSETEQISRDLLLGHLKMFEEIKEYATPRHVESMKRVMDRLMKLTDHLIVVVTPEHSIFREKITPRAAEPFWEALAPYETKGVKVIDMTKSLPDDMFRDLGHALPRGREILSRRLALEIRATLKE